MPVTLWPRLSASVTRRWPALPVAPMMAIFMTVFSLSAPRAIPDRCAGLDD
jgi:hypothetical protein